MNRRKEQILKEFLKENHNGKTLSSDELIKSLTVEIRKMKEELKPK